MFSVTIVTRFTPSKRFEVGWALEPFSKLWNWEESLFSAGSRTPQSLVIHYVTQSLHQLSYTLLFQFPFSTSITKLNTLLKTLFRCNFKSEYFTDKYVQELSSRAFESTLTNLEVLKLNK
jgi:hypothetical protein